MVSKSVIRSRLQYWNVNKPPNGYSQSTYSAGPDGHRYRNDCSGYVSMLVGLTSSPATSMMSSNITIARRIGKGDLTFGDVMLTGPTGGKSGHVVLFDRWADATQTAYLGHDFGSGTEPRHKTFTYPYGDSRPFLPYRLLAVSQDGKDAPSTSTPTNPADGTGGVGGGISVPDIGLTELVPLIIIGAVVAIGAAIVFTQLGD